MKKRGLLPASRFGTILLLWSMLPYTAFAQTKIKQILDRIIKVLEQVVLIVFVLAVVVFGWGIIKLITAAGNPNAIKEAKYIIFWSIIGMVVLASIFGIIVYLQDFFLIDAPTGSIPVPQF